MRLGKGILRLVSALVLANAAAQAGESAFVSGYRPHPNPLTHHTNAPVRVSASSRILRLTSTSLPSKYDLRDIDGKGTSYLSPVRDQDPYGTCWTFAAMAGIEYQMRRDEGLDADLSENNLAATHGFSGGFNSGGNNYMSAAVFLRHCAPVAESLDPYPDPDSAFIGRGVRIPRKIIILPNRGAVTNEAVLSADLAVMKNAIYKYGVISAAFSYYDKYRNGAAYYCDVTNVPNHAIAIVGWDDDYPASNFRTAPPGDGAFIIRNSWGTHSSTEEGYNYISYYDATLGVSDSMVFTSLSDGSDYGPVYQYDPYGFVYQFGYGGGHTKAAAMNLFTARTNETLAAFGFYAVCTGTTYKAYVVKNASVSYSWRYGNTLSGSATLVKSGVLEDAGYEVIDFDDEISVSAGETFAICVEMTTPLTDCPVPVMCDCEGYVSGTAVESGKSYINWEYETRYWEDLSADGSYFCCKVYPKAQKEGYTTTSKPAVPYTWLDAYAKLQSGNFLTNRFYGAYNALADYVAANGYTIAGSYARGLDPDNSTETNLVATIRMEGGEAVVEPSPKNTALWDYSVLGSGDLKSWHEREAGDRFFRIKVLSR